MDKKSNINFKAIGLSLIFLFNPNVAIVDILPDFIGYILLCLSLVSLSDINETIASALSTFKKMIYIDFARILAILWIFGMSLTTERNSSILLWSFVLGILEIVFAIPAFIKLFKGLAELGYLYENLSVINSDSQEYSRKNPTDKIKRLTVVFLSFKAILSFLPEFADITSSQYSENSEMVDLYRYIGIMRILAFIPVLILGIIWILKCNSYFRSINKDKVFVDRLNEIYNKNILPKKGIFIKRNILISFVVLLTAVVFSFDSRLEYVNILPDFVCGALMVVFFKVLSKKTKFKTKPALLTSYAYIAVSVVAYSLEILFFKNYYYSAIYRSEKAMSAFIVMAAFACLSSVIFLVLNLFTLKALDGVIDQHTGIASVNNEGNMCAQQKISDSIKKELRKYSLYCLCASVLYVISDICYAIFAKDASYMFFINTICAVVYIVAFVKLYLEISEAVNSKYILE